MAKYNKIRTLLLSYFIMELFFTILEYGMFALMTNWTFGGMELNTLVKNILVSILIPNQITILLMLVVIIFSYRK